ncbi:type I-F CRISPR-associated protein Csy3 [Budvicia aquatica]|uniref:CRISPR type I-F/YPEST-associated protein Csy3 n=1 Tax=Budvicia aquatica TaxID=82979 RepID=A0A2C6CUG4_9GAMM|nr:type I-F CRISPR-associated protein Csy3 [Budvicia aquatica]PHI30299.1 type I-F CRISPR-associated protein Cas7f/Csy3 [Budvicia aquatica]VFS49375.1 CRISPR type I-F/YPEST-associated protein Csy3 [Budvicia aquatica]
MSKTTLKTASVLAFERNFDVSDAVFYQTNWDNRTAPVKIKNSEKSVRGTISNRLKNAIAADPTKLDAEIEKANLQTVDVAALNQDNDTLLVKWSLKVLPFTGKPCVCNNAEYQSQLEATLQSYIDKVGFDELAKRYATNIANARFLWRNRMGAEHIDVVVKVEGQSDLVFDAKTYSLVDFKQSDAQLEQLAQLIKQGLAGERFVLLHIEAFARVGKGQEVYPSQELILDQGSSKGKKSKTLYAIDDASAMHSQKISNALRTIDTWYPDAQFPIAVEPYGAVTSMGTAFRQPKVKTDFYSLFDSWVLKGEAPALEQQHYVAAILIRGGVFGESGKE